MVCGLTSGSSCSLRSTIWSTAQPPTAALTTGSPMRVSSWAGQLSSSLTSEPEASESPTTRMPPFRTDVSVARLTRMPCSIVLNDGPVRPDLEIQPTTGS
jgi:hypothetical protein